MGLLGKRWMSAVTCSILLLFILGGCGGTQAQSLPDLSGMGEVQVIAREEGSGTRAEWERLANTRETGTDEIAVSTQEVLEKVSVSPDAIGYAAYSAIPEGAGVKVLAVDGITPSAETIRNGRYPLCRNYTLAYMGELSDLGRDFLTYVLGAGQAQVGESCIPVAKTVSFLSGKSAGTLTIQGSSSAASLMEALIEDYRTYNPNGVITLRVSDSTAGLTAAIRRDCDLALSSRSLEDHELELLETAVFAQDAVAVVVHPDNPLTDLTKAQLKSLYDGSIARWADLAD